MFIPHAIGPSFPAEVAAAGLLGQPFSTSPAGVLTDATLPADKLLALQVVIEAHDPTKPAPASVPDQVELYQFAGQAVQEGIIEDVDARGWLGAGTLPPKLEGALDQLLASGQIDQARHGRAIYFLMGSKQIPRTHPLTPMLGALLGKDTPAKLDQFFIDAAAR